MGDATTWTMVWSLGFTALWSALLARSLHRDHRQLRCGFFALLTTYHLLGLLGLLSVRSSFVPGLLALATFVLILLMAALPLMLVVNGLQVLRREGRRPANVLSLLLGIGLVAAPTCAFVLVATGKTWSVTAAAELFAACLYLGSFLVILLAQTLVQRLWGGRRAVPHPDAVVVHGAGLINGTVTPLLASRVRRGVEIWQDEAARRGASSSRADGEGGLGSPGRGVLGRGGLEDGAPAGDPRGQDAPEPSGPDLTAPEPSGPDLTAPEPGTLNAGVSEPGTLNTGVSEPGGLNTGVSEPGTLNTGVSEPGTLNAGVSEPGMLNTGVSEPGGLNTGVSEPGTLNAGVSEPGTLNTDVSEPGGLCRHAPLLVMSGGQGADEPTSEASAMAEYAVGLGVPRESIVLEDRSTTTRENIAFTRKLLADLAARHGASYDQVLLVTSSYHAVRTAILASDMGTSWAVAPAPTASYYAINAWLREYVAVLTYRRRAAAVWAALMALIAVGSAAIYLS